MSNTTIRAAVFRDGGEHAHFENLTLGELRADEVLVKLVASGVCHTDLTCRNGFMTLPRPIILGHEGAGIVERVGSGVTSVKPGDRVVMSFLPCGTCANCVKGVPAYCLQFMPLNFSGRRMDGSSGLQDEHGDVSAHFFGQSSFASHSVANERNVVKVRDEAPLELLGPLGCGVQTGAGSVMNVLQPEAGQSLAVFGAGGVGLSAVMAAKIVGCNPIIVVEPRAERRALALEVGATHVIDPMAGGNLTEQLGALTNGMLDCAFDTSGVPDVISAGALALGPRGKLAMVTANKVDAILALPILALVGKGITLRGVNMGDSVPHSFIPKLIDYIVEGRFPIQKIARFYAFDELNHAMEDQENGSAIKPILLMAP